MTEETKATFSGWSIVELFGHRRLAGMVSEQEIAGVGLLRLDVPGPDGAFVATQFYHPNALYCLTPTTEEIARAVATREQPQPVQRWELPAAKPRAAFDTCPRCGSNLHGESTCRRCGAEDEDEEVDEKGRGPIY